MKLLDFSSEPDFSILNPANQWEKEIIDFWEEWKNAQSFIEVQTSGSTGKPKRIKLDKKAVKASAQATCEFFTLTQGKSALLCLPAKYIAGKMMLVRAEYAGLNLWLSEPNLSIECNKIIDFCAMTPSQCQSSLDNLAFIRTLILGGSAVSESLKRELKFSPTTIYETYGMTETISHIALKNMTKDEAFFHTLPGVSVSLNNEFSTLNIEAPRISKSIIQTHDIAALKNAQQFKILGRLDNVVNSGGVKIIVEPLEKRFQAALNRNVIITGIPDELLGQQLVLVVEGNEIAAIQSQFPMDLSKFEIPKKVYYLDTFERSENGKILRKDSLKKIKK